LIKNSKDVFYGRLNEVQKDIINYTLQEDLPLSLILGPPGTGKSKTIKEIINQSLKRGQKVLVTAFSNTGCDNLFDFNWIGDSSKGFYDENQFIRIGRTERIEKKNFKISLEEKENFFFYKMCLNRIQETFYNKEDQKLIKSRKEELTNKLNLCNEILLEKSNVIFTTCVSSGGFLLNKWLQKRKTFFDLVIIDEASQALEAACWIPILLGKKVIIVGDFNQTGPIVNSNTQIDFYTLFERLYRLHGEKISRILSIQYRMHEKIMRFPSIYFYEGKLEADSHNKSLTLKDQFEIRNKFSNNLSQIKIDNQNLANPMKKKYEDPLDLFVEPLIFVNTEGEFGENVISTTKYNQGEAMVVKWFTDYLCENGVDSNDIGIITPYNGQVNYLEKILNYNCQVSTVDGFQGSEKEIIILSFVRSNNNSEVGFLADKKRINVALTRPKKMLIIICDSNTLKCNSFMKKMINYYFENSKVFGSEFIVKIMNKEI